MEWVFLCEPAGGLTSVSEPLKGHGYGFGLYTDF
jgi:hypothetical protein